MNLLVPFEYLWLRHNELRAYKMMALAIGLMWLGGQALHVWLLGATMNFFHLGGALDSIQTLLSVMVGIYFGLAGVFGATSKGWLDGQMPGGIPNPGNGQPMTRRAFFMRLLVYCASMSTVLVFITALAPGLILPMVREGLIWGAANWPGVGWWWARVVGSSVVSSVIVVLMAHLLLSSLLSSRFLSRDGTTT